MFYFLTDKFSTEALGMASFPFGKYFLTENKHCLSSLSMLIHVNSQLGSVRFGASFPLWIFDGSYNESSFSGCPSEQQRSPSTIAYHSPGRDGRRAAEALRVLGVPGRRAAEILGVPGIPGRRSVDALGIRGKPGGRQAEALALPGVRGGRAFGSRVRPKPERATPLLLRGFFHPTPAGAWTGQEGESVSFFVLIFSHF